MDEKPHSLGKVYAYAHRILRSYHNTEDPIYIDLHKIIDIKISSLPEKVKNIHFPS